MPRPNARFGPALASSRRGWRWRRGWALADRVLRRGVARIRQRSNRGRAALRARKNLAFRVRSRRHSSRRQRLNTPERQASDIVKNLPPTKTADNLTADLAPALEHRPPVDGEWREKGVIFEERALRLVKVLVG